MIKILSKDQMKIAEPTGRILLGLLMLVPGILKLIDGGQGITGLLTTLGFPIPAVLAWIVLLSEIIFGLAILANYKLEYTVLPPMVILLVAVISTNLSGVSSWSNVIFHLVAISSYWMYGAYAAGK